MRVAILSLTRDRLWSTQHCFQRLHDLAGCDFDHYVFDNGSEDETAAWLKQQSDDGTIAYLRRNPENVGISRALNHLLDQAADYDVVVKLDNDCELTVENTVRVAAELVMLHPSWILSPCIRGLQAPPTIERELELNDVRVGLLSLMGGIFMAASGSLYRTYRHDESNPVWGMDDVNLCAHWQSTGGSLGYLLDYPADHYLTTEGQRGHDPTYFERKDRESRTRLARLRRLLHR